MLDELTRVRFLTASTGGESVYLFLEFTINTPLLEEVKALAERSNPHQSN